jgi:uncharacterized membrane protein YhaH (DUF805 family)
MDRLLPKQDLSGGKALSRDETKAAKGVICERYQEIPYLVSRLSVCITNPSDRLVAGTMNLNTFIATEGRIGRKTYWLGFLVIFLVCWVAAYAVGSAVNYLLDIPHVITLSSVAPAEGGLQGSFTLTGGAVVVMGALLPAFALMPLIAKRLNDRDRGGWMRLLFVAPNLLLALLALVAILIAKGIVATGGVTALAFALLATLLFAMIVWLWAIVELGVRRGTIGPNRYGADPAAGPDKA